MQPVASSPTITPAATAPTTPAAAAPELAGGGVQGLIGDMLRSTAAGYQAASRISAVQADKAAIHPFEAVSTATGVLKEKTAGIKGVGKATSLLHTIGGFGMLILTANVSGTVRAPGDTAVDLVGRVADMIDGRDTANGWGLGWGLRTPDGKGDDGDAGQAPGSSVVATSALGAALAQSGMK